MKNNNLVLIFLLVLLIGLTPIAYQNVQEQSEQVSDNTLNQRKEKKRKSLIVNGQRYDGFQKYAYVQEAMRRGQEDLNVPSNKPVYKVGYLQKELEKLKSRTTSRRTKSDIVFAEHGPANFPGRTRGLIKDIEDSTERTWFAGSIGGGIWKTSDAGNTWTELTRDMPNLAVTWIVQSPSAPNVLYASTGEKAFTGISASNGQGLMKSIDKGETWEFIPGTNAEEFSNISRMIVDPTDENTILISSSGKTFLSNDQNDGYIFKSTDGGNSWTKVFESAFVIAQIIADPKDFNKQYASINNGSVIRSSDAGETWTTPNKVVKAPIDDPNLATFDLSFSGVGRIELAIANNNTDIIYASVNLGIIPGVRNNPSSLYISTDGGESWIRAVTANSQTEENWLGFQDIEQGNYDNTALVSPLNDSIVYLGGIGMEQFTMGPLAGTDTTVTLDYDFIKLENILQPFRIFTDAGVGISPEEFVSVEIRFGVTQKAHRFTVPEGATSGVPENQHFYQDYVDVPFQVWDIDNDQQLMVSFRDNNDNGIYDLNDDFNLSRSYIFVNNFPYADEPEESIAVDGGHVQRSSFLLWLVTPTGVIWDTDEIQENATILLSIEESIEQSMVGRYVKVANPYQRSGSNFTGPNSLDFLHPDHHNMMFINATNESFTIVNANDGGVYISDTSLNPGIRDAGWYFASQGYNTTTYYGADKSPTEERFIGGPQDQGTNLSPEGEDATAATSYREIIGGDGFEAIWHHTNPDLIIGSSYFNFFGRTLNGGETWSTAVAGITDEDGPFVSRLSTTPLAPDLLFAASTQGVYRSENFGGLWQLQTIEDERWRFWSAQDVEVSQASPQVVWVGGMMREGASPGNIFVSTDGGYNFNRTNNYDDLGLSTGIYSHPFDPSTAYVLFAVAGSPKILKTTDLGETWEDITQFENGVSQNGFPDVAVFSLLVMPHDTEHIWAGTELGIVESFDGGSTWSFLNHPDFRSVNVWDMKIKGDRVVLATHGRGIWTAQINELLAAPVAEFIEPPVIEKARQNWAEFALDFEINFQVLFDSINFVIDDEVAVVLPPNEVEGLQNLTIPLENTGTFNIRVEGYKNGLTYRSNEIAFEVVPFNEIRESYSTDFESNQEDWVLDRFSIGQSLGFSSNILRTPHPYPEGQQFPLNFINLTARLAVPIIVSEENPNIFFREVVLVEIGEPNTVFGDVQFWDYVIVEGTKDGVIWEGLLDGYDSQANELWLTAYNDNRNGRPNMFRNRTINMLETFAPQDTIQIRFRLFSDPLTNAWGWGIDDLYIQEEPPVVSGLNDPSIAQGVKIYPVPTFGNINLSINNVMKGEIDMRIVDFSGRELHKQRFSNTSGVLEERIDLNRLSFGMYILELSNGQDRVTKKFMKL